MTRSAGKDIFVPNPQFYNWMRLFWQWSNTLGNNADGAATFSGSIAIGSSPNWFKADSSGIWLGGASFAASPFRVSMAGALTATNGTFTGSITGATNANISGYIQASGTASVAGTIQGNSVTASVYGASNTTATSTFDASVVGYNASTSASGSGHVGVAGICADTTHSTAIGIFGYAGSGTGVQGNADQSGGVGTRGVSSHASGFGMVATNSGGGVAFACQGASTFDNLITSSSIAPTTSNTYDLGSNTKLYANSWAYFHNSGAATVYDSNFLINTGFAGMSAHLTHNMAAGDYKAGSVPGVSTAPYLYFHVGGKIVGFINGIGGYATA